jgi:hypothetical protein
MQLLKSPTVFMFVLVLLHSGFPGARAEDKMSCAPGSHNVTNLSPDADPRAPDIFKVSWSTSAGEKPIVLEGVREWSPLGVDHLTSYSLCNIVDFVFTVYKRRETRQYSLVIPMKEFLKLGLCTLD